MTTIYWRDIPAQLTVRTADDQRKVMLAERFQHAIDRAAGVAGLTSTDDYVEEWRSEPAPLEPGDITAQLDQLAAAIDRAYPRERLDALVAAGGIDAAGTTSPQHETDSE